LEDKNSGVDKLSIDEDEIKEMIKSGGLVLVNKIYIYVLYILWMQN
jgi:hypothetical protein